MPPEEGNKYKNNLESTLLSKAFPSQMVLTLKVHSYQTIVKIGSFFCAYTDEAKPCKIM